MQPPRVLVIAGSDSGGGAGIQADIKTITALGGYASAAITAITAQDTCAVHAVHPIPADIVKQQIRVVLEDIGADSIKIGMLHNVQIIKAVAEVLADYPEIPIVLDPVMVSTSGSLLLEPDAIACFESELLPHATVLTPNIPEAEQLTSLSLNTIQNVQQAALQLHDKGANAVLIKGGHAIAKEAIDTLYVEGAYHAYTSNYVETPHTHGTGCTLASAIACFIAKGCDITTSVEQAHAYVHQAIVQAPGLGKGKGPLWHMHTHHTT